MSRRQARELALQAMFQLDFNALEGNTEDVIRDTLEAVSEKELKQDELPEKYQFTADLVQGTVSRLQEIDELIAANARDWKISRMPAVDRNILRLAVYEMRFRDMQAAAKDVLKQGSEANEAQSRQEVEKIVINEAVELAKKFGTDDSPRFINGVLGAVIKA